MFGDFTFWNHSNDFPWNEKDLVKSPAPILDLSFKHLKSKENDSSHGQASCLLPFGKTKLFLVPIKDAKILVDGDQKDDKKVIEIIYNVKDITNDFLPGDTIGIVPENSDEDVNSIINILGLEEVADLECSISIKSEVTGKRVKIPPHIPRNSSLRKILKDCVSFTFPPKKQFFRLLYDYSSDEKDKRILGALCARDSKCFNEALKFRFNLINALNYLNSCRPTISVLLENLPRLLPRPYSIATSPLVNRDEIKIVFSVLNSSPGRTTKMLENLTYKFLKNPKQQTHVNFYLRERNSFKYSEEEFSNNIIMISVGCAISPFIGFMQHKAELNKQMKKEKAGKAWLLTGARNLNAALYKNEIHTFLETGVIDRVFESFSRDATYKYKYVQDCIIGNSEEFVNLILDTNTITYVCADGAEISRSIQKCIEDCIAKTTNCDLEEAKHLLASLKKEGKYREDIWI